MRCTNRSLRSRKLALTVPQAAAIWPGQRRKGRLGAAPVRPSATPASDGNPPKQREHDACRKAQRETRRVAGDFCAQMMGEFCGKGLVVRLGGLEPPTSGSTIRRSNQLSYNRTSLPGASPPDAASAFTDEALPHLAAQYGQSADISRLLRLASTLPVDDVRRRERRCDGCNQGKEKGRGRRSGLFPMNGQREEVLA